MLHHWTTHRIATWPGPERRSAPDQCGCQLACSHLRPLPLAPDCNEHKRMGEWKRGRERKRGSITKATHNTKPHCLIMCVCVCGCCVLYVWLWMLFFYSRYCVYHIESHFHSTVSVIRPRLWQTGDTIITVAQQLNAQTMMLSGQSIKAATTTKIEM